MADKTTPDISVVVPNYNNDKYIGLCLESILDQNYSNIEVIVVDDRSSDQSLEIINRYLELDHRVQLIVNDKNSGVSVTRDHGIKKSRGRWVTTLDSDDIYIDSKKLEKELAVVEEHSKAGCEPIGFSGIIFISADGEIIGRQPGYIIESDLFESILLRNCMIPRDFLFTKKQYLDVGGYDHSIPIYEDWDLKIRLAAKYPYYFSGIDGVGYRRHGEGLSAAPQVEHIKCLHKIFLKNIGLIKQKKIIMLFRFYQLLTRMIYKNMKLR